MRRLLTITALTALLLALPFAVSVQAQVETGGSIKVGSFMTQNGKSVFGISSGAEIAISTDTTKKFRIYNYTGFFAASTEEEDVEGATQFLVTQKYFKTGGVIIYAALGNGFLYEIEEAGNEIHYDVMFEAGVHVLDFIGIGMGFNWLPGAKQTFLYGTINLVSPL